MGLTFTLSLLLLPASFLSSLEEAWTHYESRELVSALDALDRAYAADPDLFSANNLDYLRGRIVELQNDWNASDSKFSKIGPQNPLYPMALWHRARALIELGNEEVAHELLAMLPRDFPNSLKLQLADRAPDGLALTIYAGVRTRESRLKRAKLRGDDRELWSLVRGRKTDDVALDAARLLMNATASARQRWQLAEVFYRQREFEAARALYEELLEFPAFSGRAHFQIGRVYFQQGRYDDAIEAYRRISRKFEGTRWERDAAYQIASCYWRLGDYASAEKAYLDFIDTHEVQSLYERAVRNLVDVYRATGDDRKALLWLDRALERGPSAGNRQAFLFSKAKILLIHKDYPRALEILRQLQRVRLRRVPNGSDADEVRYLEGLCLWRMGRISDATEVWTKLAANPFSYYGQKAAAKIGITDSRLGSGATACSTDDKAGRTSLERLHRLARPVHLEEPARGDAVSELIFLRLWDEAFSLAEQTRRGRDLRLLADLAYVSDNFDRTLFYADGLLEAGGQILAPSDAASDPASDGIFALLYPKGFKDIVCDASSAYDVDPLWLYAIIWQESRYKPSARSAASARGLMQFIPETARSAAESLGIGDLTPAAIYDPEVNIRMGAYYWAQLMNRVQEPELALAAYNAGLNNVERWKQKCCGGTDLELFVSDVGFVETKNYVMRVVMLRAIYAYLE